MFNGQQLSLLFPILLIFVFYFLLIRPQKKREKQVNEMRNNLKVGDKVITIGGICGKIVKIKDDKITIEISADKTKLEMMRWSISSVEASGKAAPEKKQKVQETPEVTEEETKTESDNTTVEENKENDEQ